MPLRVERVAEVTFGQLQNGRFRHGVRFLRWRDDRDPESCRYDQLDVASPRPFADIVGASSSTRAAARSARVSAGQPGSARIVDPCGVGVIGPAHARAERVPRRRPCGVQREEPAGAAHVDRAARLQPLARRAPHRHATPRAPPFGPAVERRRAHRARSASAPVDEVVRRAEACRPVVFCGPRCAFVADHRGAEHDERDGGRRSCRSAGSATRRTGTASRRRTGSRTRRRCAGRATPRRAGPTASRCQPRDDLVEVGRFRRAEIGPR